MTKEIKLPELGDGIESGDVLEVLVKVGDWIEQEQGIVELETDKATVEVPCSHAGTITKVHVAEGQTVPIGGTLITVEERVAEAAAGPATTDGPTTDLPAPAGKSAPARPAPPPSDELATPPTSPPRQAPPVASEAIPAPVENRPVENRSDDASRPAESAVRAAEAPVVKSVSDAGAAVAAGPAVRRFAREVGVDLEQVEGTGMGGRITREDVLSVVRKASQSAREQAADDRTTESDEWGPIRIEKMPKIRQTIAKKMHESWETVPRVTNYDDADVTELEHIRQASKADYAERGIKLTSMPFVIKAVAMALKQHPAVNASLDMQLGQVTYKQYVNVGIAVDTERGLVVPAVRGADERSISEIATQLAGLAELVRSGKFQVADLRGSTFTISNLGAIGGTYSTPIINIPEVAILLVGRSRKMPVVIDDQVEVRLMMPLSLSYDHRLVDGAAAARFLNDVIAFLSAPSRLLLAP